jgi:hypothetical protein
VDSLNHAREIIDGTHDQTGVEALLVSLGFVEPSLPLDTTLQQRLGLPSTTLAARVATAPGSLRALTIELAPDANTRLCIAATARRLAAYAPQLLWLIVAVQRDRAPLTIATWRLVESAPRIFAMVTERGNVVDSDAETLCALAAASVGASGVMLHMRWLDILGRDAVTRRFFTALSGAVKSLAESIPGTVPSADRREIAILTTSRLLFLSFLETKGWLNGDFGFLANGFADCMSTGGGYQRRVLEPLFFGTLNTRVRERAPRGRSFGRIPFLNGGLFARTAVERIHRHSRFDDDAMGALFGDVLVRYRFTAREDAATWSQTAIDPEMLGKVFESLMESSDRKRGGVFFTPQRFVERLTLLTLSTALGKYGMPADSAIQLLTSDNPTAERNPAILRRISNMRILDPACGSGAFLVHMLERIAHLRIALGDDQPLSDIRRAVLTRSIFGVDSSPTAVWLCELRLWLSAIIDSEEADPMQVTPLPNLDRQIRVGDSLAGDAFTRGSSGHPLSRRMSALHNRYVRASGRRKAALGKRLDIAECEQAIVAIDSAMARGRTERREILHLARTKDLFDARGSADARSRERLLQLRSAMRSLRQQRLSIARGASPAFSYTTHFATVAESGGFDVIIGNPPWVRIHNISSEARARYREHFSAYRTSAWVDGARGAKAGSGFGGQVDLAALFLERSTDLVADNGTIGLLLPSKLWRSLAGGGARQLTLARTHVQAVEDYSAGPDAFEAAVYPSMLVATRAAATDSRDTAISVSVQRHVSVDQWNMRARALSFDATPGSPWLLIPPDARKAFDRICSAGVPLFESVLRRPHLGVKTGCNDAFVVRAGQDHAGLTRVCDDGRHGEIETELLRPLVRGETLDRWRLVGNQERIIWTHDELGSPVRKLPPYAHRWLAYSRRALERRSDSRSVHWWSLFRVDSARFNTARVVWCDFGRTPRAAVIDPADPVVPLNTCYSVACAHTDDALAFCALLNSDVAASWLAVLAEPARGGYHRYLGWTIARLPIPIDWPRARRLLAPIASRARDGQVGDATAAELRDAVLSAYGLTSTQIHPLLAWTDACRND